MKPKLEIQIPDESNNAVANTGKKCTLKEKKEKASFQELENLL